MTTFQIVELTAVVTLLAVALLIMVVAVCILSVREYQRSKPPALKLRQWSKGNEAASLQQFFLTAWQIAVQVGLVEDLKSSLKKDDEESLKEASFKIKDLDDVSAKDAK